MQGSSACPGGSQLTILARVWQEGQDATSREEARSPLMGWKDGGGRNNGLFLGIIPGTERVGGS